MTLSLDDLAAEPERTRERIPGDFKRTAAGAPQVAHPTKTTKDKATGEIRPQWVTYGRPSGLGKKVGDAYQLSLYSQRMVAVGMATDPTLVERAQQLVGKTNDDDGFREIGNGIAAAALDAAKAGLAADRGTHVHALTEDHDTEGDPIARMERGDTDLGLPVPAQQALVKAWTTFCDHYGLEVLATEAKIVQDDLRVAGTLDRIVRLKRDLTFLADSAAGSDTIPAGTVLVLDIKTGKLRVKNGHPQWWHDYAIQTYAYATGTPYDPDTNTRSAWPWQVSDRWALICHLDVRAALDGEAKATMVLVDLQAGKAGASLVMAVDEWERRHDLFIIDTDTITVPVENDASDATLSVAAPGSQATEGAAAAPDVADLDRGAQLAQVPTGLPDEGGEAHPLEVDTWRSAYASLDAAGRTWISGLLNASQRHLATFHLGEARTARRLSILAGLIRLVRAEADEDDTLRALVALAVDADWPLFANVEPGHAVGAMNADEAERFAALAEDLNGGRLVADVDDGGHLRYRRLDAA